jgi:hypothetical protein
MARKFTAKRSADTIPAWLSLKIRDAGASAYAWGETELLERIDPDHKLQSLSDAVTRTAIVAASALLVTLGFSLNTASGLITVVIAAAGLVHTGARRWSSLTLGTVLVAMWPLRSEALGMFALALFVALGVLGYIQARGSRVSAALASYGALAVAAAGVTELLPVVLLLAATGTLVACGIIRPKLGNDVPFLRPGPPPSTIPWLVRVLKRRDIKHVPDDIRRKTLGAEGERATALRLMGLQGQSLLGFRTRAKALAVHDIASLDSSKTRANLDHLVLTIGGVFVLDTKVFAAGSTVAVSSDEQDVVVLTPGGQTKSVLPLIHALVKECVAAREALSQVTTGFLVIHGARVPRGISVRFERDGVTVEVIDQKDLIGRLDAPRRGGISRREFASLSRAIRNIPSASGGRSVPTRPLRLTFTKRPHVPAPTTPSLIFQQSDPAPAPSGTQPARMPDEFMGKWDAMLTSPPAPADLVDADMRGLARGHEFEVFSIAEDLSSVSMYAMTGPCMSTDGSMFVWATDGPNWRAFMQTKRPVAITRVPLGQIIITSPVIP